MVQELEFHAGQVQRLVVQRDFQGLGVHAQPVHTEHTILPVRAFRKPGVFHAPQNNPDAGEQFPRGEGFRHIVVRAELKGDDAVRLLVALTGSTRRAIGESSLILIIHLCRMAHLQMSGHVLYLHI